MSILHDIGVQLDAELAPQVDEYDRRMAVAAEAELVACALKLDAFRIRRTPSDRQFARLHRLMRLALGHWMVISRAEGDAFRKRVPDLVPELLNLHYTDDTDYRTVLGSAAS